MPVLLSRLRQLVVVAFLGAAVTAWAQEATGEMPAVRLWAARDYNGGPINLAVVQHPVTGFIYVGNGRGVLEFDGVRWRLIALPARGPGRTLAIDATGMIWVGSYNEIAVLRADTTGELRAMSVIDRVMAPDRLIEFVSQALPTPRGMCIVEQGHIFLFSPEGGVSVWKCAEVPLRAWWMDAAIHVTLTGRGIVRLDPNGELTPVATAGSQIPLFDLGQLRVLAARPLDQGRTMLLTSRGPAVWESASRVLRPIDPAIALFEEDEVTAADFLSDGRMMFATESSALVVLDAAGQKTNYLPAFAAFKSGRVTDLMEGNEGGIWAAKAVGLARVQFGMLKRAEVAPPLAVVRRVVAAPDHVVLGGATPRVAEPLVLQPEFSTLRIELAAPAYRLDARGRSGVMFRTQLAGFEESWGRWTTEATREYVNLPLRSYTLRVQARDIEGRIGAESTFAFSLLQHWWLTSWAMVGYAASAVALLGGSYSLLTRAHRRRAAQLEAIVAARTEDLRRSNAELARLREIDRDEKVAARLAEEKARLEVLRYQLNPHFLYNALNSLYSLVLTTPPAAADMVLRLADFCRVALERSDEENTSLGTCFDRMALYLEIEKVRWGAGLQIEIAADAEAREEPMPPFLLLPLLENAIKYGGATSPELLRVQVTAHLFPESETSPRRLEVEVANTGHWAEAPEDQVPGSTRIGLENLRQRLRRYYPDRHDLVIESRDGWVRVKLIVLPRSMPSEAVAVD